MPIKIRKARAFISILLCTVIILQLTALVSTGQACGGTVITPGKPNLDVEIDVGSLHFTGEIAEFYVLVFLSGDRLDAKLCANLYYNGTLNANLTSLVERVDIGLYRIPYTIPNNASAGAYALVVDATYPSCLGIFEGTALKSFQLSQTLTGWNAWLTEIRNTTATIKTDINTIQVSLENINAIVTNINENIVTIQTDIGVIKTDIDIIGLTLTKIEGNITTINTSIGNIQGNITSIQSDIVTI